MSGGKTSSYMAVHYPADVEVFSLVRIEDSHCTPRDKKLVQRVADKIGQEFIATAESDLTLYAMFDLEQMIGREIVWVSGKTFDRTIQRRKHLPNIEWRFCTKEMKLRPIQKYCKQFGRVEMRIGFRWDEFERGANFEVNQSWRVVKFPLIEDKISHYPIYQWAKQSGIIFPSDSNCVGCFHKPIQQLRKNFDDNPKKMEWFALQETNNRQWKKEMDYFTIKNKVGLQQDFFFGTGSGCQAGFCTD